MIGIGIIYNNRNRNLYIRIGIIYNNRNRNSNLYIDIRIIHKEDLSLLTFMLTRVI